MRFSVMFSRSGGCPHQPARECTACFKAAMRASIFFTDDAAFEEAWRTRSCVGPEDGVDGFELYFEAPSPDAVPAAAKGDGEGPWHAPWEPLGQIDPDKLPDASPVYPGPWTYQDRGNGHLDIIDSQGRNFAHVYCWDSADWQKVTAKLNASRGPA